MTLRLRVEWSSYGPALQSEPIPQTNSCLSLPHSNCRWRPLSANSVIISVKITTRISTITHAHMFWVKGALLTCFGHWNLDRWRIAQHFSANTININTPVRFVREFSQSFSTFGKSTLLANFSFPLGRREFLSPTRALLSDCRWEFFCKRLPQNKLKNCSKKEKEKATWRKVRLALSSLFETFWRKSWMPRISLRRTFLSSWLTFPDFTQPRSPIALIPWLNSKQFLNITPALPLQLYPPRVTRHRIPQVAPLKTADDTYSAKALWTEISGVALITRARQTLI